MIKRLILALALLLPGTAYAQLGTVPNTFTSGTPILASEVNTNFSTAYANALNRTGGTMTGTLSSLNITPATTNTYDLGTSLVKFRDLFLSRNLDVAGDFALTGSFTDPNSAVSVADQFMVTSTTAPQLQVRYDTANYLETVISSSGAVTFNAIGAGQAFSFSDPVTITSGAIAETAITDGAILARVAAAETITASWTFTDSTTPLALVSVLPLLEFNQTNGAADERRWFLSASGNTFNLATLSDSGGTAANVFYVERTGTTVDGFYIASTTLFTPSTIRFVAATTSGINYSGGLMSFTENNVVVAAVDSALGFVLLERMTLASQSFAGLPAADNGTMLYCTNCTIANPCAGAGTGAIAKRINGAWVCN